MPLLILSEAVDEPTHGGGASSAVRRPLLLFSSSPALPSALRCFLFAAADSSRSSAPPPLSSPACSAAPPPHRGPPSRASARKVEPHCAAARPSSGPGPPERPLGFPSLRAPVASGLAASTAAGAPATGGPASKARGATAGATEAAAPPLSAVASLPCFFAFFCSFFSCPLSRAARSSSTCDKSPEKQIHSQ